jgi:hypothetical protein
MFQLLVLLLRALNETFETTDLTAGWKLKVHQIESK